MRFRLQPAFLCWMPECRGIFSRRSVYSDRHTRHEKSFDTIRGAIADNAFEKRLPAIIEARRRVIEDYNLGNMIAKHIIEENKKLEATPRVPTRIKSRHTIMRSGVFAFYVMLSAKCARGA